MRPPILEHRRCKPGTSQFNRGGQSCGAGANYDYVRRNRHNNMALRIGDRDLS
jgi:hypothetical protein